MSLRNPCMTLTYTDNKTWYICLTPCRSLLCIKCYELRDFTKHFHLIVVKCSWREMSFEACFVMAFSTRTELHQDFVNLRKDISGFGFDWDPRCARDILFQNYIHRYDIYDSFKSHRFLHYQFFFIDDSSSCWCLRRFLLFFLRQTTMKL